MNDECEESLRLFARHYAKAMRKARDQFVRGGEGQFSGLAWFDRERHNIEAAQTWSASRASQEDEAAGLCIGFSLGGWHLMKHRLTPKEQRSWLASALSAARFRGDRSTESDCLGYLGNVCRTLRDLTSAENYYLLQLAIVQECRDRAGEGRVYSGLGNIAKDQMKLKDAIHYHEQDLHIARELSDRYAESRAVNNLGIAWRNLGEPRKAISYYEQRLDIVRDLGDRTGEGRTLGNIGGAWATLGCYHEALDFFDRAIQLHVMHRDIRAEALDRYNRAEVLLEIHDHARAREEAAEALRLFDHAGMPDVDDAHELITKIDSAERNSEDGAVGEPGGSGERL